MNRFETVILSDLHLGARNARTNQILQFLHWVRTERLILAGDVFDTPSPCSLDEGCLRVIDALAAFSGKHELVWLRGNHDPAERCVSQWDAVFREEMVIDVGGRPYVVCHGHTWDKAMELPAWIISGADAIYHFAQRLDSSHRLARRLKRSCKFFCRSVRMLQDRAVAVARQQGLCGVILGHSHVAHNAHVDGVHYLNCGCWTEMPSSFVGIRNSQARSYYWDAANGEAAQVIADESEIMCSPWPAEFDPLPVPEAA